ncbi:MAG: GNAT family N-acetyltransferase [Muribaculaceae bacterium]|nr:GNAT family N-acetyltransferase [Muribaculaceae bacterium]
MEFQVKKTTELSKEEINQINSLFKEVFDKERSEEEFLNQSVQNPLGYSYHSLMIEDNKIVGLNSYVPSFYLVTGQKLLFANSTDSMVSKHYRDFFNFKKMVDLAYKEMAKDDVKFVYGYPNDNSFPVLTKSKLMKDIGKMYTYCLPIHIGGVKPVMAFLNPLSEIGCRIFVFLCSVFASSKVDNYFIEKQADSYNITRYQRGDGEYQIINIDDFTLFYKIKNHEGVRTAFIIDISKKSPESFNKSVKYLIKKHKKEFDLILYPGYLKFNNTGLIKLPKKFEPKNFNFTGKALDKNLPNEIWDINNWDTNLSNYDLI